MWFFITSFWLLEPVGTAPSIKGWSGFSITLFDTSAELIFGSVGAEGIPSDPLNTPALTT